MEKELNCKGFFHAKGAEIIAEDANISFVVFVNVFVTFVVK